MQWNKTYTTHTSHMEILSEGLLQKLRHFQKKITWYTDWITMKYDLEEVEQDWKQIEKNQIVVNSTCSLKRKN